MTLNRNNKNLLSKLVDISMGKKPSIGGAAFHQKRSASTGPCITSLNYINRNYETERITRENKRLAEKLTTYMPTIQKKKQIKEWKEQKQVRQRLKRASNMPEIKAAKTLRLPALRESMSQSPNNMHSRKSSIASLKFGKKPANQTSVSELKTKNSQKSLNE